MQALEVGKLRKKITDFESKQNEFRRDFTRMRFFRFKCRRPYEYLAQANKMIIHMEDEMQHLQVRLSLNNRVSSDAARFKHKWCKSTHHEINKLMG